MFHQTTMDVFQKSPEKSIPHKNILQYKNLIYIPFKYLKLPPTAHEHITAPKLSSSEIGLIEYGQLVIFH